MFIKLISQSKPPQTVPREGDLYKEVTVLGKTFTLRYGYYEEFERHSRYNEPMPIYPDFLKNPVYTDDGTPFATDIQDVCPHFEGKEGEDSCAGCRYFRRLEDLFGICTCAKNRRPKKNKKTLGGNEL